MAEVVGLVASVATLVELSLKLGKLLSRFRDAPDELFALSNEITDLRFLFAEIEKIVRERPDSMTRFSSTLDTAEQRVEAVRRFLQKVDAFDTTIIDRVIWMRHKGKVGRLQSELRDSRLQLDVLLGVDSLASLRRIERMIKSVQLTVSNSAQLAQSTQIISLDNAQKLDLIGQRNDQVQNLFGTMMTGQAASRYSHATYTSVTVRKPTGFRSCKRCKCRCHAKIAPRHLSNQFLGALFSGYCNVPLLSPECSEDDCQKSCISRGAAVALTYRFPTWVFSKAIQVAYNSTPLSGPAFCIKVQNVVGRECEFFRFAEQGNIDGLKSVLASGSARLNDSDESGKTALHHASFNQQFEALEWLIQVGGDPFIGDEDGMTVLTLAGVWIAHQRVLGNTLPEADTFCQLSALDENWNLSEIHEVILQLSHKPLADVLVDPSSEINATDAYGRTAVWWAALLDIEDALRTLLENGADPNIHSTIHDLAPLGAATSMGCIELLLRYGANVKEVDRAERNILQLWTDDDDLEPEPYNDYVWIRKFIRTCADRGIHIDARDSQGYTALANTVYYNHHSVLEVFLKLGADYTIRTNRNETILHIAARRGDTRTLAILAGHKLPGIDLDARTTTGRETALKTFESLKECKSPDEIRTFYHLWRVVSLKARGTDVVAELGSEEETWADESENQREGNIDDDDGDSDFFEDAPEF